MEPRKNLFFIYSKEFDSFEERVATILVENNVKSETTTREIYDQTEMEKSENFLLSMSVKSLFSSKVILLKIDSFKKMSPRRITALIQAAQVTKNWVFFWAKNSQERTYLPVDLKKLCTILALSDFTVRRKKTQIKKFLTDHKVLVSEAGLEYLINVLPNTLSWVSNELQKIEMYYAQTKKVLTPRELQKIVFYQPEERVFGLIEQMIRANKPQIIDEYLALEETGTTALYLTTILGTYLLTMKKAEELKKAGKNLTEIATVLNKNSFYITKLINLARDIDSHQLFRLTEKLLKLELYMKTQPLPEQILLESFLIL